MDNDLAARLQKLESLLAHLEHQYDQLNQVVVEQGRELGRLRTSQQKMAATIEQTEGERVRATNAKPPHYQ